MFPRLTPETLVIRCQTRSYKNHREIISCIFFSCQQMTFSPLFGLTEWFQTLKRHSYKRGSKSNTCSRVAAQPSHPIVSAAMGAGFSSRNEMNYRHPPLWFLLWLSLLQAMYKQETTPHGRERTKYWQILIEIRSYWHPLFIHFFVNTVYPL